MDNIITKYFFSVIKTSRNFCLLLSLFFLFVFQTQAADFYWVGGTGNWNDFATHWATTSGGVIFHANAPTATDDVFFDVNSGAAGYAVTLDVVAVANNFTFSGNSFSFVGANSLTINGTSTNSSTQAITFGGASTYTFTGAYTAVAASQTRFTTSDAVAFSNNITIGNGSTFSFTPDATTTVTGAFNSSATCAVQNTINSTGGNANVTFGAASNWRNTNITNITATGTVTFQFGTLTTSFGITDNTLLSRNLFWVGGTGNWNNTANWSLTSGGTGGECIPRANDDVNFDGGSGLAAGTVTLNVAAPVRNFNFDVAGATFNAANPLTVNGITNIATLSTVNFDGTSNYVFTGDFTAAVSTITNFGSSGTLSLGNVTIEQGSEFRFSSSTGANATVSGAFIPNGNCTNPVILSATGGLTAPVNFTNTQTWSGVEVTQINSTGNVVTVNSKSVVVSGNFTNNTTLGRTLYWVGGTGNWSDPAHWSLANDGTGGGECIPTALDDVNFNSFSFPFAGQSITMDIDGICKDMNWTAGLTNNPRFTGAAVRIFTIAGSLTFSAAMTQTGLAPTFEGLVVFNSATAQTITMAGKGLNSVRFQTGATGEWTVQDDFTVRNQTLLNSGTFNTNGRPITSGSLSVNNGSQPDRTLNLGSSTITLNSPNATVLDYTTDLNFILNSDASTINVAATNSIIATGSLAKILSNITYAAAGDGDRVINTGDAANTITFQDITTSDDGTFDINGTSPKVYDNITIGNNVISVINGVASNLGNTVNNTIVIGTGGTTVFNGGYDVTGNVTTDTGSTLNFGATAGNNSFGAAVTIGDTGTFLAGGAKNNTFVGTFTLGISATATFSNTTGTSTNSFSDINLNSGATFKFNSGATALSTISGDVNIVGSCAAPVTLTSNNPPVQATVDFANAQNWTGVNANNILATTNIPNISIGTVGGNTNITGDQASRELYWIHSVAGAGSVANWYDAANWADEFGVIGQCPPTIYDNVFFDANSFSAAGQIVNMNNDAFCRDMDWSGTTNDPFLQSVGSDTDLTVGGNLIFVPAMTVGTGGTTPTLIRDIYFAATNAIPSAGATTNNTIDWGIGNAVGSETINGKRFRRAFFNQDAAMVLTGTATWTLASAFNLTQDATNPNGALKLIKGNLVTANNPIEIRILDANNANGILNIGNSIVTLRATGLTFDFQNDALFTFTIGATSEFILSSNSTNVIGFTGSVAKTIPTITVPSNNNVVLNTGNGTDRITFRNIDLPLTNVTLNITGTSPKTYSTPLSFNNGTNATFTGSSAITPDNNIFTGSVAFGTGVEANFVGENEFQDTFVVGSTVNSTTGIRFTGNGRNQFLGNVTLNGSSGFFSLQNTSANPNTFTTVNITNTPLATPPTNSIVWEFSRNSPNTVAGAFAISADCEALVVVRGNGGVANAAFAVNQSWENVLVSNLDNTGAGIVNILSSNAASIFGNFTTNFTNRTLYWVGNTGNWSNTANWSLSSGGPGGECIPTLSDDVFFDGNSFNGLGQTVTVDVDAQTRDMSWVHPITGSASGTPNIVQGATGTNMQIGGDVTFIAAMNWDYNRPVNFRYTDELEADAKNVILSEGQVFKNNVNFEDDVAAINGVWELGDAFATNAEFGLTAGIFTTGTTIAANNAVRAATINVNKAGDLARTLRLNSSAVTVTQNAGLIVDFRGNTNAFTLESEIASSINLIGTGNQTFETGTFGKTIPNLFISTPNVLDVNANAGNRITFRDITGLVVNTTFNVNGSSPKTYGNIKFLDNITARFDGTQNALVNPPVPLAPLTTNIFSGTVDFDLNSRIIWNSDNTFQDDVTIQSTRNTGRAVDFVRSNIFTNNAPLTFQGLARVGVNGNTTITVFGAPVNFNGVRNELRFDGDNNTVLTFESTLFVNSTQGAQADVDFRSQVRFEDNVEFGVATGGTATGDMFFARGVVMPNANTTFTTGNDSRVEFRGAPVILRDMIIGENNELTFNSTSEIDNMQLSKFDVVNFPQSNGGTNSGTTTINEYITAQQDCSGWINIRSNTTGVQAQVDFETEHSVANGGTEFRFTFIQDIWNRDLGGNALQLVEADPDVVSNIGNNLGITFINNQLIRTYYWVRSVNERNNDENSTGNWNDEGDDNHWSLSSGGSNQLCIPTANDNVVFDDNSFVYTEGAGPAPDNETVTIDKFFSYARNITWNVTDPANRARIIGGTTSTLQIFGDVSFSDEPLNSNLDWNQFTGTTEFKGITASLPNASKTIEMNGARFFGPVIFNAPFDDWTLLDSMRVEGGGRATITIAYGNLFATDNNIRLQSNWTIANNIPTLPQARFIAGTGTVTFDGTVISDITIADTKAGVACTECSSVADACSTSPFYNLTSEKTWNTRTEISNTISILNNFHIVGGTFEDDGYQIRGNPVGNVYMAPNTLLRLGDNDDATVFPTCYLPANINLSNGATDGLVDDNAIPVDGSTQASIVEYRCPDDQMVAGGFSYGTLRLISSNTTQGNNTKRFTGEATIEGAFFIGDEQTVYDMGYQIRGNSHNQSNNSLSTGDNVTLVLGTNQTASENTYTITNVEPNVTVPLPVAVDIATTFPKFTVGNGIFGDGIFSNTKVSLNANSTVIYNANANQEVAGGITYGNIILRATGATDATRKLKTITLHNATSTGVITIAGNALTESFNHFIDDGYQITGNGTGTFIGQANSKMIIGNQTSGTNFPNLFRRANITLDPNDHETIYNADVPQFMSNEPIYGNVTLTAPNSIDAALIEKRFRPDPAGTNGGLTADIRGNLIINPRNHLIDEGNQITGLASKFVRMNSDVPNEGRSWLTIGTNGATNPEDIATQFPLNFGTVELNDSTTVRYNAGNSVTQSVRGFNGNETSTNSYYNLIIQAEGTANANKNLLAPTRVRNNLLVLERNIFRDRKFQITGNPTADLVGDGILKVENNAQLVVGRNVTGGGTPTRFPFEFTRGTRIDLDENSTIRYESREQQQLISSEPIYGNIYLDAGHGGAGAGIITEKLINPNPVGTPRTALELRRDMTVDIRVRLIDDGVQIQGNTPRNLVVQSNSELVLGTNTIATLFPTGFQRGNTDLTPNAGANTTTVIYNSSTTGNNIAGGAGLANTEIDNPIYGNVILRSVGGTAITKNLLGNVVIRGDLTIEDNNTLETVLGSNFNINLAGDWECKGLGAFNSQQGRVILDGTTEQQIRTNAQKFFELEASSTGGSFRMMDNITIKTGGKTIFNNGLFIPNDVSLLGSIIKMIFEENATVGGSGTYTAGSWVTTSTAIELLANGPSNTSHVVGKVEKQGTDAFMFPIGNGTNYAPAGLSERTGGGGVTPVFEARYVGPRLPTTDGYDVSRYEPTIFGVSNLEYWLIDRLASTNAAFVYLSWDNPRSAAYLPEALKVLRWNGPSILLVNPPAASTLWTDKFLGGYSNASAKGVIASQATITDFGSFTFGTENQSNPLPLDLLSFDAKIEGKSVKITWETTNEIDNSHYLVERSQDATSFGSLGRINAKGTGLEGKFNYQFWDAEPFDGLSYYRLQMFDTDGTFKYSPVRSVLFEKVISGIKGEVSLYPNPNGGSRFYLNLEGKLTMDAQVEIIDMTGRLVHKQEIQKGAADIVVTPMRVLPAGTYILRFVTSIESITKKFVVE